VTTFIDASALLAVLDADDEHHAQAKAQWILLVESGADLLTTNYVLVETFALVQARLGMDAVRTLDRDISPLIQVDWIDMERHLRAVAALVTAARRRLSLVDCASFDLMRRLGVQAAFTFDRDFSAQGFAAIP